MLTANKKVVFNIPAQRADLSLISFAEQASLTLIFPFDIVKEKTANALEGRYQLEEGLKILLAGTGLSADIDSDGQLKIVRENKGFVAALSSFMSSMFGSKKINNNPAAQESLYLEEVTVNARRKSENLQLVPDTIVALSGDTIKRANITEARDISMRIPNVSVVESLSPTSTYIIVRGIASVRNSEPAVAVIVDGVQIGSATEVSQSYHDIEQIELLKGPQGALYGRNAVGGALIITSKKPTDEFEMKLTVGQGSDDLEEASGSISGPLAETLHFRLSANYKSYGGNIRNEFVANDFIKSQSAVTGTSSASKYMDFQENNDVKAQLIWEPTPSTMVDYRYAENDLETGAMWFRNFYRLESDANKSYEFPVNSYGNPTAIRTIKSHTIKLDQDVERGTLTSITNVTDTEERYGVAGETRGHDRTGNVMFNTDYFVNEFLDDLSDPADIDFFNDQLASAAAGEFVGSDQYYEIKTVSQEFRFAGDIGDDFNYIAGAYMLLTDRDDTIRATWEAPTGSPFDCIPAYEGGPSVSDQSCNGLIFSTVNEQDNSAWAVFFSADYQLAESLIVTAAARYDEDRREVTRIDGPTVDTFGLGVGECDSINDPDNCSPSGSTISKTFTAFQPKLSLAYTHNDKLTLYATYARGFRSGGFNASGALLTDTYDSETLDSFEVGLKSPLFKDRVRANFSLFHQRYENAQQFEFDGNVFVQSLYNIPKSEINGLEASFDFVVSETLTVDASFGVMDSKIIKFDQNINNRMLSELRARNTNTVKVPAGTQAAFDKNFKGAHLPSFAHKTANIGLLHELPILANRMLTTRIDYNYTDELYWWIDEQDERGSLGLVDASIALAFTDGLELQLWCKNCTDEIYDSEYSTNERELFNGAAKDIAYRARGKTYGMKLNLTF